jgi:cytoplasmic FMR1 interacting protein
MLFCLHQTSVLQGIISSHLQFPIDCSLPWILASHALTSTNPSLVDNVLLPFDIYNDAGNAALYTLKQRHLYDEVEAEVRLYFLLFFPHFFF